MDKGNTVKKYIYRPSPYGTFLPLVSSQKYSSRGLNTTRRVLPSMSLTRPELKFSDKAVEKLFFRKLEQLPSKDNDVVIRIVDHKDYFTCVGADADLVANDIYHTPLVLKEYHGTQYVTILPQVMYSLLKYVLLEKGMKVEFYSVAVDLICVGSPGNLDAILTQYGFNFEFADGLTPVTAALKVSQSRVGMACCDSTNGVIWVSQFDDNELYSNVELALLQLGVKEVLTPYSRDTKVPDQLKLLQMLGKIDGILVEQGHQFSLANLNDDLAKILDNDDENVTPTIYLELRGIDDSKMTLAMDSVAAVISHLLLLELELVFDVNMFNLKDYMRMDLLTIKALNLFPSLIGQQTRAKAAGQVTSVYELFSRYCKTTLGQRLLSQWLKQPLTNLEMILERQQLVQTMMDASMARLSVHEWLQKVPDIKRLMAKVAAKLSDYLNKRLDDIVRLYQLVQSLPALQEALEEFDEPLVKTQFAVPIADIAGHLTKFAELVEYTVDLLALELTLVVNAEFNVKPEFDDNLVEIANNLQRVEADISAIHEEVGEDLNMELNKKLKLEKHQVHGWALRVTRNDLAVLRNTGKKYPQLQTVKAGVYFTTPRLRELSQEYEDTHSQYNSKQSELIRNILDIVATYLPKFSQLSHMIGVIDVIVLFATAAITAKIEYVCPQLSVEDRHIDLRDLRHPVLEEQPDLVVIANDVEMSPHGFLIITGPNMGGKLTYIRQIGVIALMAQIGLMVPAALGAKLPVFDAILLRIGASDSQLKGLSTFMVEMLETSLILALATTESLIIIDELGRGTLTYDGFGLASAISEHLISNVRCSTLFATHFHELTDLSQKYPAQVTNLHVVAEVTSDSDDITLMYKVEPGVSDQLFGIHVAEVVQFPAKIINMAKRKAQELQDESGELVKRLKASDSVREVLEKWKEEMGGKVDDVDAAVALLRRLTKDMVDGTALQQLVDTL